jgi:hypothetical protein
LPPVKDVIFVIDFRWLMINFLRLENSTNGGNKTYEYDE